MVIRDRTISEDSWSFANFRVGVTGSSEMGRMPACRAGGLSECPKTQGLSEAAREMVSIADTIVSDGAATRWTGILETELECARQVEQESVGLKLREIEQAAMATFLHSQPTGRSAKTRDLMLLVGHVDLTKSNTRRG